MKAIDLLKRLREDEDYRDWNNDEARAEFEDVGKALGVAGLGPGTPGAFPALCNLSREDA